MGKLRSRSPRGQSPEDADAPLTPTALAKLLSRGGDKIQAKLIKTHIANGAPTDDGGRLTLASYAAWLAGRISEARANGNSKPT